MRQIAMDFDEQDEIISILFSFIDDVYQYLGIELPDEFDPEEELINVVQAIKDKQNAI